MHNVLFYNTRSGNEPVLDFIRSFSSDDRRTIGYDLHVVQDGFPIGLPVCRSLGSGLYEVRTSLPSGLEVRLIFFHSADHQALIVVHGFIKKSQKTPAADKTLALHRKREFAP